MPTTLHVLRAMCYGLMQATERFSAAYPLVKAVALAGSSQTKSLKPAALQLLPLSLKAAGEGQLLLSSLFSLLSSCGVPQCRFDVGSMSVRCRFDVGSDASAKTWGGRTDRAGRRGLRLVPLVCGTQPGLLQPMGAHRPHSRMGAGPLWLSVCFKNNWVNGSMGRGSRLSATRNSYGGAPRC